LNLLFEKGVKPPQNNKRQNYRQQNKEVHHKLLIIVQDKAFNGFAFFFDYVISMFASSIELLLLNGASPLKLNQAQKVGNPKTKTYNSKPALWHFVGFLPKHGI
jgi:hypothetical protein